MFLTRIPGADVAIAAGAWALLFVVLPLALRLVAPSAARTPHGTGARGRR